MSAFDQHDRCRHKDNDDHQSYRFRQDFKHLGYFPFALSPNSTRRRMASERLMSRAVAQASTSLNDGSRTVTAGSRPVAGLPTFFFWCTLIDLPMNYGI